MKIDVHIHTKAIKSGDAPTRQIDPKSFCDIVKSTDVKICAITNHNHFDIAQYKKIVEHANGELLVWPGIEVDVLEDGRHGHLIVIANPNDVKSFDKKITELLGSIAPDNFATDITSIGRAFDEFDPIFIPHYYNKTPSISNEDIELLASSVSNRKRILKEANNSISAGIFIGHGHKTIYGSDVTDWNDYPSISQRLPDLRLPVESFEQFCLLIERDDATIDTIRNKKFHQTINIKPFKEDSPFDIEIWDDINVIFGSKGTGKTDILKALSKYYSDNGHRTTVFESNQIDLSKRYDIAGNNYQVDVGDLPIESCQKEIERVRSATEKSVTSMRKYLEYFSVEETSKISRKIKLKLMQKVDCEVSRIQLGDTKDLLEGTRTFLDLLGQKDWHISAIGEELYNELIALLKKVEDRIVNSLEDEFRSYQVAYLFNNIVEVFTSEIARKTGQPEKPLATGFAEYSANRIEIEMALNKITMNIDTKINPSVEFVGDLGKKGKLFCKTVLLIQNGDISNSDYKHLKSTTKNPEKNVARALRDVYSSVYSANLFEKSLNSTTPKVAIKSSQLKICSCSDDFSNLITVNTSLQTESQP